MILSRIFTSFTFRFLVSYVAWLSVAVFMVLALIYAVIAYDFFSEVHRSVKAELQDLSEAYELILLTAQATYSLIWRNPSLKLTLAWSTIAH